MSKSASSARSADVNAEWFAEGLRFECTQCGNCCTGPPGYVWFTDDEGRAMATALDMEERAFLRRHARRVGRRWTLREHRTEHGYDCSLLERDPASGRALCRVYAARPTQCRTWPFWPENLESREVWEEVKRRTPCPGMNEGPLVPIERIRIIRDQNPADE